MTALIRTTSLTGFRELAEQFGGQPDALLQRYRIDPQCLFEEDARVPLRSLVGLLECAARELKCPDFGLRMADYQDLDVLGPIALIARSSATVGQALEEIVRFIGFHSPGIELDLDISDAGAPQLLIDIRLPGLLQQRQMIELAMGVAHNIMKLLCGPKFAAQAILLSGSSPLSSARYRRFFKTTVYSGQVCSTMVLTAQQLEHAIEQQDLLLHRTLVQYFSHFNSQAPTDLVEQVEWMIVRTLATQRCRLPIIAEQLGLHERVLQRRLDQAGQGFEAILENVRRQRADSYLAERSMPMSQVSGLLGYSEQSVFNRACRRWFAMTPRARRRQLLEA
ncbi:AraC family transcriptional regulator [Pseudomonas sp. 18058]|uniref:AraC family transcriptional regulator n=1 Tax=Pseudomonas sp. 18058 TaxID=2681406 RepID=UPI00135AE4C6|nr:AraC family transcriptional regulator [Pseudomonas sp. 18058]